MNPEAHTTRYPLNLPRVRSDKREYTLSRLVEIHGRVLGTNNLCHALQCDRREEWTPVSH